jgi:hypothetical protein
MTTRDLTRRLLPYVRHALLEARPDIIDAVGRAGWVILWPAWAVVTGPFLPLLVRIGVELAIGLVAPPLVPILDLFNALSVYIADTYLPESSRAFLAELTLLLRAPLSEMLPPVRDTLALSPDALAAEDGGQQP